MTHEQMRLSETQRRVLEKMSDGVVLHSVWGSDAPYFLGDRDHTTVRIPTFRKLWTEGLIEPAESRSLDGSYQISKTGRAALEGSSQ